MAYSGETTNFGLPYRQDGDLSSGAQEQVAWEGLDGVLQGVIDGIGVGVLEGGHGTLDPFPDTVLSVSALKAIIPDGTGGVYVEHEAVELPASFFEGVGYYLHVQLTATSRADRSCVYYADSSPTPAADALVLCYAPVGAGNFLSVDNTVKAPPAVEARLAWERITRNADDPATLLENLAAWLGTAYVGETPPADVDTRLTGLESGGGGGGGGTVYWNGLERTVSDPTTIAQAIAAAVAAHLAAAQHGGGGGTAVTVEDDVFRANDIRSRLLQVRSHSPDVVATQRNALYIVDGVYGDGSGGSPDFVDHVNSTW